MWRFSKRILTGIFLSLSLHSAGQTCDITVSGMISDSESGLPVSHANVLLKEAGKGAVSDSLGRFRIGQVCPGDYHLLVSHIGCEPHERLLSLRGDTFITILLDHSGRQLDEVAISAGAESSSAQPGESLKENTISENTEKNLANLLDQMSGVSTLRNGNGIAKPVVHGLYGNRLMILNNGIPQNGQQWGVDHSPEIDPLSIHTITVIKGVAAIAYQGSSLGSVILAEPGRIKRDPHLHGRTRFFFESNGLGGGLNLQLQQYNKQLAWRASGTLKRSGDRRTPDYYLRNTGNAETNFALQLEKIWTPNWMSSLYFSTYNTQLGVLRGSHIGNISDLEEALGREVPFYTEEHFSYRIDAPYQKVHHHLLKLHSKYYIDHSRWIDLTYAAQWDQRKEFDVRRSGRSADPSLSLKQFSHFLEIKYEEELSRYWKLKTGVQLNRTGNFNVPETGILPLIPDYIGYESGLFGLLSGRLKKLSVEFGARYDYEDRRVATISSGVPREVIRYENHFHNLGVAGGAEYALSPSVNLSYNLGYASRNPEVNELYSNGLHQGVSGIEEGNPHLQRENSLKSTFALEWKLTKRIFLESLLYLQSIQNYIFLNPQDEFRLTIRGAFPVFKYEQTHARIYGADLALNWQMTPQLSSIFRYSYIRGQDLGKHLPLVYIPSNNLFCQIAYRLPKFAGFGNLEFQLTNRLVLKQRNLLESQDYLAPPSTYNLVGVKISAERQGPRVRLNLFAKADNLLNVSYRDYLNRQRYFANDLGINLVIGASLSF